MGSISNLRDVGAALWRRLPLMLVILAVGLPLSVWFALSQPRLYEATAVLQIEPPRVDDALTGAAPQSANAQLDLIEQQLMARDNIVRLIDEFDLFDDPLTMTEKIGALRESTTIVKLIDPAIQWRPDAEPSGLSITVRLDDPVQAAAVANAMIDSIVTEAKARADERAHAALSFFSGEEERLSTEIAGIEAQIAEYRRAHVDSLPEGLTAQRERLADLNEQLLDLDRQLLALESGSDRLRVEDVERQRSLLQEQRQLLTDNVTRIEAAIAATPNVEQELSALQRQLDRAEAEFEVVTQRRTDAAMTELLASQDQAARFVVLEQAVVPEFAVSTSRKKLAAAGAVATLIAAVAAALALELRDPALRSAAQMERQLGVQPVIVIPNLRQHRDNRSRGIALVAAIGALGAGLWALVKYGLASVPRTAAE